MIVCGYLLSARPSDMNATASLFRNHTLLADLPGSLSSKDHGIRQSLAAWIVVVI